MNVWRWKESWRDNIRDVLDGLGWDILAYFPSRELSSYEIEASIDYWSFFSHFHRVKTLSVFTYLLPFSQHLWYVLLSSLYINIYNFFFGVFFVPSPLLGWYLKYVFQTIECWYLNKGGFGPLLLAIFLHMVYLFDNEPSKQAQAMYLIN